VIFLGKIDDFRVSDLYLIAMTSFMVIANLIFFSFISGSIVNVITLILVIFFTIFIVKYNSFLEGESESETNHWQKKWKNIIFICRNAYYAIGTVTIYSQFQEIIKALRTFEYDIMLNNWDVALLGMRAGDLLANFTHPYLTEFLQIAYSSFYFLPLIVGAELLLRNKEQFETFAGNIVFTFYFSYFLYLFMPAIGPRFCVYDFSTINLELPGIYATNFLREFINYGGGIIDKTIDPASIVNRDCMPSGHTMVSLITIYFAIKYKTKTKFAILLVGMSIIIATIYLRYHYLVDIIAGIIFAFLSILIEPYVNRIFMKVYVKLKTTN
jgi:membrane-associated phospholipid phosphatase